MEDKNVYDTSLTENKDLLIKIKAELEKDKILMPYLYFVGNTNVEGTGNKVKMIKL